MPKEMETPSGKIVFADELFASIVALAVQEAEGVAGMASRRLRDDVAGLLRRESPGRGIEVRTREGALEVSLDVIVDYGVSITEVARTLIQQVRRSIREATGFEVDEVLVRVQGIREPKPGGGRA